MDKDGRDQLRRILGFHPGDIIPIPGSTKTIIELIDQIDELEQNLLQMSEISLGLTKMSIKLLTAIEHEKAVSP